MMRPPANLSAGPSGPWLPTLLWVYYVHIFLTASILFNVRQMCQNQAWARNPHPDPKEM